MYLEIAGLVLGVSIPVLGWGIGVIFFLRDIRRDTKKLIEMHEHAEEFGFGTRSMNDTIESNTRAIKALTHYVKWIGEHNSKTPPPYVDNVSENK